MCDTTLNDTSMRIAGIIGVMMIPKIIALDNAICFGRWLYVLNFSRTLTCHLEWYGGGDVITIMVLVVYG